MGYLDSPPPSATVHVEFGARTRLGPRHLRNGDHHLVVRLARHQDTLMTSLPEQAIPRHFEEFAYGMVIADGLGPAGEHASRLAVGTLADLAITFGRWNVRVDEPVADEVMGRAEAFFKEVDVVLAEARGQESPALQTAMTAVYTAGTELFFAHVGHSRAYLFRDGGLLPLTHDHTLDPGLTFGGRSAEAGPRRLVTRALGRGGAVPRIDIERCGLLDGDAVLLCTNGLTDAVAEQRIADELRHQRTADEHCHTLIDLAMRAEGVDDVTVLLACYRTGD
jgi:protein phosphatase